MPAGAIPEACALCFGVLGSKEYGQTHRRHKFLPESENSFAGKYSSLGTPTVLDLIGDAMLCLNWELN